MITIAHGSSFFPRLVLRLMIRQPIRFVHRWIALVFTLPLIIVVATGMILSFVPLLHTQSIRPGSLSHARLEALIKRHDPEGRAPALTIEAGDNILTLEGPGRGNNIKIDIATGELATKATPLSDFIGGAKELHRRLIFHNNWLTLGCAFAMLVLAGFGLMIGFARLRNNPSGWHKAVAWSLLPLVVVSPLTGALDGLNITFVEGRGLHPQVIAPLSLIEALRLVDAKFDPATIYSISTRGRASVARVFEDGALRAWNVSGEDMTRMPRNLPREIHEGTWSAAPATFVNAATSMAILFLIGSGAVIWLQRKWRSRRGRAFDRSARGVGAASR